MNFCPVFNEFLNLSFSQNLHCAAQQPSSCQRLHKDSISCPKWAFDCKNPWKKDGNKLCGESLNDLRISMKYIKCQVYIKFAMWSVVNKLN